MNKKNIIKKMGEPFTFTVNKIEFFSFSNHAVPFYHLNDGRIMGGPRLGSFKDSTYRQIVEEARNPRVVINSYLLWQMNGNGGYEYAQSFKQKMIEEVFPTPQSIMLQEVSSPEWEYNKFERVASSAFFIDPELLELHGDSSNNMSLCHDIRYSDDWNCALLVLYISPAITKETNKIDEAVRMTVRAASRMGVINAYKEFITEHQLKHGILINVSTAPWWMIKSWVFAKDDAAINKTINKILEDEAGIKYPCLS